MMQGSSSGAPCGALARAPAALTCAQRPTAAGWLGNQACCWPGAPAALANPPVPHWLLDDDGFAPFVLSLDLLLDAGDLHDAVHEQVGDDGDASKQVQQEHEVDSCARSAHGESKEHWYM